jgi:hypothetical protein
MTVMQVSGRVPDLQHDGDPEQVRSRMFDRFTSFGDRREPLLVIVDDAHLAGVSHR